MLRRFLGDGALHSDEATFYDGISSIPTACFAKWSLNRTKLTPMRHWNYPEPAVPVVRQNEDTIEAFSELFDDAIRIRLRSDVTVGLTLSGGLDSTTVLALARAVRLPEGIEALFAGAEVNFTERRPALHMACRGGADVPPADRERFAATESRLQAFVTAFHRGDHVTAVISGADAAESVASVLALSKG